MRSDIAQEVLVVVAPLLCVHCGWPKSCDDGEINPSVSVTADPASGSAPLTVTLHAQLGPGWTDSCMDTEVEPESLLWDVDGDGLLDFEGLDTTTITTAYDEPGLYTVSARVVARLYGEVVVGEGSVRCSCQSCRDCSTVTVTVE